MPFPDSIKTRVKERAHFKCCLCHSLGVEIHHIVSQAKGGPDTESNAAPLCPSCHEIYGANPTKRKFIRQARDFWYDLCESRYASLGPEVSSLREQVDELPTKRDFDLGIERLADLLKNAKGPVGRETGETFPLASEEGFAISLPEKYWVIVMYAVEDLARKTQEHLAKLQKGKSLTKEEVNLVLRRLEASQITALIGPTILRSILVDKLAEAGVLRASVRERIGTPFIEKLVEVYKEEFADAGQAKTTAQTR